MKGDRNKAQAPLQSILLRKVNAVKKKLFLWTLVSLLVLTSPAWCDELKDFMDATTIGETAKVKTLLQKNPKLVNAVIKGQTALHVAAGFGHKEIVELLLSQGASVKAKDSNGDTPLHTAVISNRKEIVEMIIGKGAEINAANNSGQKPLDYAKQIGTKEIIDLLQSHGATDTPVPKGKDKTTK
jgi:uncharacterized protein